MWKNMIKVRGDGEKSEKRKLAIAVIGEIAENSTDWQSYEFGSRVEDICHKSLLIASIGSSWRGSRNFLQNNFSWWYNRVNFENTGWNGSWAKVHDIHHLPHSASPSGHPSRFRMSRSYSLGNVWSFHTIYGFVIAQESSPIRTM